MLDSDVNNQFTPGLAAAVRSACAALEAEARTADRHPSRRFRVQNGERIDEADGGHLYSLRTEARVPFQPETPISLTVGGRAKIPGVLIAQDDFQLLVFLQEDLGQTISGASITANSSFIYKTARDLLSKLQLASDSNVTGNGPTDGRQQVNVSLAEQLLGLRHTSCIRDETAAGSVVKTLASLRRLAPPNDAQLAALSACAGSDLHFVWGPPGTGKTACLAQTVRMLADLGSRVLVLAHSNAAVDVAMVRVADAMEDTDALAEGRVLRVGYSQLPDAREREEIQPEAVLMQRHPKLIARLRELELLRSEINEQLGIERHVEARKALVRELKEVRHALREVEASLAQAREELFRNAIILGTTLSRFVIAPWLQSWGADTLIVDEVSMAPSPMVLLGALRVRRRLLLFGDFRQLGPIALSEDPEVRRWLARDAFEIAGVRERIDEGDDDERVTLLDTQYRMAPPIAEVVSRFAYAGELRTGAGVASAVSTHVQCTPFSGSALAVVDTGCLASRCFVEPRPGSRSRVNLLHALLAISLVEHLDDQGCQSAAISPYRAQARIIDEGLRLTERRQSGSATVHRFQGAERDAVIFDLVDSWGVNGASSLTGTDLDSSARLLTVALSRARGKLLILTDVEFVQRRHPAGSPFFRVVMDLQDSGDISPLDFGLLSRLEADGLRWLPSFSESKRVLTEILGSHAPVSVDLNLPDGFTLDGSVLDTLAAKSCAGTRLRVFVSGSAEAFEAIPADVRLVPRPVGFFAFVDDYCAVIGGGAASSPMALVTRSALVARLRDICLGEAKRLPPPSAEIEALLDRELGRCYECGSARRPYLTRDGWKLRCETKSHPIADLPIDLFKRIVSIMGICCAKCGEPAVLVEGTSGPFLRCSGYAAGCPNDVPTLFELFSIDRLWHF